MARALKDEKCPDVAEPEGTDLVAMLAWIDNLMADVPEKELAEVPADLAANHEHYLYGAPKQQP